MTDVDIIIPYYNDVEHIDDTLKSIYIQSVIDNIHVIVIDDNSDKKCNHLLSKYKSLGVDIRLLTLTKNRGSGVARQVGIDHSNSPYIMFVDSDDKLYDSNSVEKLINALDSDSDSLKTYSPPSTLKAGMFTT